MTEVQECTDVQRMGQMSGHIIHVLQSLRCAK